MYSAQPGRFSSPYLEQVYQVEERVYTNDLLHTIKRHIINFKSEIRRLNRLYTPAHLDDKSCGVIGKVFKQLRNSNPKSNHEVRELNNQFFKCASHT